jgi:hypothetical protein
MPPVHRRGLSSKADYEEKETYFTVAYTVFSYLVPAAFTA